MDAQRADDREAIRAAIRLAVVLSAVAAVAAPVLDAVGDLSPTAFVLAVVVVGFATSWVRTGRIIAAPVSATARPG